MDNNVELGGLVDKLFPALAIEART